MSTEIANVKAGTFTELPEHCEHYLPVKTLADELGTNIRTIYAAIRTNKIPAVQLPSSKYVDPELTRNWFVNKSSKKGRKKQTTEIKLAERQITPGTILTKVAVVEHMVSNVTSINNTTDVVKLTKAGVKLNKDTGWAGVSYVTYPDLASLLKQNILKEEAGLDLMYAYMEQCRIQGDEKRYAVLSTAYDLLIGLDRIDKHQLQEATE